MVFPISNLDKHSPVNYNSMKTLAITIVTIFISLTSSLGQTSKDSLLVFIGEKIEVKYTPEKSLSDTVIMGKDTVITVGISLDSRYRAKYKILQVINGSFRQDTITFFAYDHYGEPAFSKFKTVLLFVSPNKGELYHEKYQYFDLYLTADNKWASPYSGRDHNDYFKDKVSVRPEKISFKEEVSAPISHLSEDQRKTLFPKPYFDIKNGNAIAIYGNYVDDLVKLKKQTN